MKKTDADTIVWSVYDKEFVEWLFYYFETVEQIPNKRTIGLMSAAFNKGKKSGYNEGYAQAREDYW